MAPIKSMGTLYMHVGASMLCDNKQNFALIDRLLYNGNAVRNRYGIL